MFGGKTGPKNEVVIVENGEILGTVTAGKDGTFEIKFKDIVSAEHSYSLYAIDRSGETTSLITIKVSVPLNDTTKVTSIILPPTLSLEKESYTVSEEIPVFGEWIPESAVILFNNKKKEPMGRAETDKEGRYVFTIPKGTLKEGRYVISAKGAVKEKTTEFGLGGHVEITGEKKEIKPPEIEIPEITKKEPDKFPVLVKELLSPLFRGVERLKKIEETYTFILEFALGILWLIIGFLLVERIRRRNNEEKKANRKIIKNQKS